MNDFELDLVISIILSSNIDSNCIIMIAMAIGMSFHKFVSNYRYLHQ